MNIINIKNEDINYLEIFIGKNNKNFFSCDVDDKIYNNYMNKLNRYNKIKLEINRLFYKNLICETENRYSCVYSLDNLYNSTSNTILVTYNKKKNINLIEFPCLKKYTHEENIKGDLFTIDKNIKIYFNKISNNKYIKICVNTENLNKHKLDKILKLFT